ncbi:phage tail protein [Pseudomonas aeruginosa]|uniref:phage tail protein n=1 Tax=Pseudomonas aeruginosa TaxID=287 RepID=UPI000B1E2DCE|nr:phage tail protein [Pseudomonas aeruginosa]RCM51505.1 Phage protein U [Pseudomonas aeruginosa]HCT4763224.1 phage tail protein [Pseudomonas aeruginosa]HDZ6692592.1 phage tail protein [Pseudomonas aeruginosa]
MIWAVLGEIEFELAGHPSGMEERTSADYAEHALIQGKPVLEHVGDGLDELTLDLQLHAVRIDPEATIRRLKRAQTAHEPLPLVLGSGDYRGVYLLTAIDTRVSRTDGTGRLISATVNVTLREYSGKYTKPLPNPLALKGAAARPGAQLGGASSIFSTPMQQVLGSAVSAGNLLRAGVEAYEMARTVRDNPAALLGQAGELLRMSEQVLVPLETMQGAAQLLADGGDLVQLGASVTRGVQDAVQSVSGVTIGNIVGRVDGAAASMSSAYTQMQTAAPRLADLAATIITRRG